MMEGPKGHIAVQCSNVVERLLPLQIILFPLGDDGDGSIKLEIMLSPIIKDS